MGQIRKLIRDQEGVALIVALGAISIMVIIGVIVAALTMHNQKTVSHDKQQTAGQNIAEAGIDDAIAITRANYYSVYPNGVVPESAGDGTSFFSSPQALTGSQGNQAGTYEVWTKKDPDRPGNVLLTAKGTLTGSSAPNETVRVSVKFVPQIFDYVLFVGDPEYASSKIMFAQRSDGRITVIGKEHVNGRLEIKTTGNPSGGITLQSRPGYSDTVTYTTTYIITGPGTLGDITPSKGSAIKLPTVNYTANLETVANGGTDTLEFNPGSAPAGWSLSGGTYTITAADFVSRYKSHVVIIKNNINDAKIKITGSAGSSQTITSTIQILPVGAGLSTQQVKTLEIVGPGITLQPVNGLAILSGQGKVLLESGANVGSPGNGALIYLDGTGGENYCGRGSGNVFEVEGDGTVYGTVVVAKPEQVELKAGDCGLDGNILLSYDGSYISKLPAGWWSYEEGGMMAFKENYVRD